MKIVLLVASAWLILGTPVAAEVNTVNLSHHTGIGYLSPVVMNAEKLVEKHAEKLGLGRVTATYRISGGATQSMEAVISGSVDFAMAGVTSSWLLTLESKFLAKGLCPLKSPEVTS